ncbi:OmpA family protein [Roseofilum sp. BLCC_M143]|uniref:OmpA family protein n=2 Tax=Roseofilum TaxID=1233426 RepID=A0ABT7BUZ1_9CYAN|nr:OmpA family protein [Roseofilum casamattae BLCC-M143]
MDNLFDWLIEKPLTSPNNEETTDKRVLARSQERDSNNSLDRTLDVLCELLLDPDPSSSKDSHREEELLPPIVVRAELLEEEEIATNTDAPEPSGDAESGAEIAVTRTLDSAPTPEVSSSSAPEATLSAADASAETAAPVDLTNDLKKLLALSLQPDKGQTNTGHSDRSTPSNRTDAFPAVESLETNSSVSNLSQLFASGEGGSLEERLTFLEQQTALINPLMPLISELMGFDLTVSHEHSIRVLTPIIDKIIENRARQDSKAMSMVLADLIPNAIAEEIQRSPREVAKALAPEVSLAIEEQIRLERNSIAKALGPEMGTAIQRQIECEREAMVDALYPVIGSTIAKYMADVIQTINHKVESALTLQGVQRKIQAKVQGVSEAELIFQESMPFSVRAIFLIHKASGLVISEYQPDDEERLESDMLAGMLTAIRSFVNDCITADGTTSELNEIEYDDSKILIEVAGYSYMAVIVRGDPSQAFLQEVEISFSFLLQRFSDSFAEFDGDPDTIPEDVPQQLEKLFEEGQKKQRNNSFPWSLIVLLIAGVAAIAIPWIVISRRAHAERQLREQVGRVLLTSPELSVYSITPEFDGDRLELSGRVPNDYLRAKAGELVSESFPELIVDNDIVAVDLPPDLEAAAMEVARITEVLNQLDGVAIASSYEQGHVELAGQVVEVRDLDKILGSLESIAGVSSVFSRIQLQESPVKMKFYYESGSVQLHPADRAEEIPKIAQFLAQYPEFDLMITGHSDKEGVWGENQRISLERAEAVKIALQQEGVDPRRLKVQGTTDLPPGIDSDDSLALSRCVRFELFRPIKVGT